MTREEAILVLDSLSTWIGCEIPITEEIVEAIKTLSKSPISPNLEEAAKKTYPMTTTPPTPIEVAAYYNAAQQKLRNAFKAGAEWDREQMLKKHIPKEHSELTELEYAFYDLLASNNITNHSDEEVIKTAKVTAMDLMNIAKAEMMKEAVEGWVAVDSDTDGKRRVTFFPQKPVRDVLTEYKYWAATRPMYESIKLDSNAFPSIKWEDEPKKVKLIIVKED